LAGAHNAITALDRGYMIALASIIGRFESDFLNQYGAVASDKVAQPPPVRRLCSTPKKDICSRNPALRTGLVQQPVQIVASHDLTLFVSRLLNSAWH